MKPIHVFSAGTHTAMDGSARSYGEAELAAAAAAYDPKVHEAPLVIGHPKTNAPAYGWIKGMTFADGKLVAEPDRLNPEFAELVKQGAYKKVSASFFLPEAKNNPNPGKLTLRHVGFLGAHLPSLKGLDPIEFGEVSEGDVVEFAAAVDGQASAWRTVGWLFRKLREQIIARDGLEAADETVPDYSLTEFEQLASSMHAGSAEIDPAYAAPPTTHLTQETQMSDQDTAALDARKAEADAKEAELKAKEAELEKKSADFAEAETKRRRKDNEALLDGLIEAGKFAPGAKAQTLDFMDQLDPAGTVEFGEGDDAETKTPLTFFRDLLGTSGQIIEFGEVSADDSSTDGAVNFAAPDGYDVDRALLDIHKKALAYQAKNADTTYAAAVRAVGGR